MLISMNALTLRGGGLHEIYISNHVSLKEMKKRSDNAVTRDKKFIKCIFECRALIPLIVQRKKVMPVFL